MATYTTPEVDRRETEGFYPFPAGTVGIREASWTGTLTAIGDIIKFVPINKGERVVGLTILVTDASARILNYDVGNSDSADCYIDHNGAIQLGGIGQFGAGINTDVEALAAAKVFTANDTINLKVTNVSAVAATPCTIVCRLLVSG